MPWAAKVVPWPCISASPAKWALSVLVALWQRMGVSVGDWGIAGIPGQGPQLGSRGSGQQRNQRLQGGDRPAGPGAGKALLRRCRSVLWTSLPPLPFQVLLEGPRSGCPEAGRSTPELHCTTSVLRLGARTGPLPGRRKLPPPFGRSRTMKTFLVRESPSDLSSLPQE